MKNKLPKICYWCGIPLTIETIQREHVPPLTFFPKGYRNDLMTVPSCKEHNNSFSELDEKFQLVVKLFRTNDVAEKDLFDRVMRGLSRKEKKRFLTSLDNKTRIGNINGEPFMILEFEKGEPELFIEKIIRGIYFYHSEKIAKGIIESVSKRIKYDKLNTVAIVDYLVKDLNSEILKEGDYSNPKVFKYQFLEFEGMFVIFMQFYENVEFIGCVFPEGFSFD
ncbi:hypothetical protein GN157_12885 [Flavobacterium rakeshii]|uniref:HNH endonuclease n=1 Tax=Flavobacterium rakeshii TaxID=1038845 RepID=A0A6N8HFV0_9FLAO|nr:hypothetical protein [Flavobacterium rakeshii]MUV04605.1 hypothetical protein [Flavobacterium rakeshii]